MMSLATRRLAGSVLSQVPQTAQSGLSKFEPHSCRQCDQAFWTDEALQKHLATHGSAEKCFTCEICNKSFRFRSNLAEHRSVHTALKPFVCKFCGKSSRLKGNLTKHIIKHHKYEQDALGGGTGSGLEDSLSALHRTGPRKNNKDAASVDFVEKSMLVLGEHDRKANKSASVSITHSHLDNRPSSGTTSESPDGSWLNGHGQSDFVMDESHHSAQALSSALLGLLGQQHANELLMANTFNAQNHNLAMNSQKQMESLPVDCLSSTADSPAEQTHSDGSQSPSTTAAPTEVARNVDERRTEVTKCTLCNKHFRKARQLAIHMTVGHGHPPPSGDDSSVPSTAVITQTLLPTPSIAQTDTKPPPPPLIHAPPPQMSPRPSCKATPTINNHHMNMTTPDMLGASAVKAELAHMKHQLHLMQQDKQSNDRSRPPPTALDVMDARVGRLEKQVETVLTTMYTLVQLQTGMNQTLQLFQKDAGRQLQHINQMVTGSIDEMDESTN